jgi:hypothetical protein
VREKVQASHQEAVDFPLLTGSSVISATSSNLRNHRSDSPVRISANFRCYCFRIAGDSEVIGGK